MNTFFWKNDFLINIGLNNLRTLFNRIAHAGSYFINMLGKKSGLSY